MKKIKLILLFFFVAVAGIAFGTYTANIDSMVYADSTVYAACEDDECELGTDCQDNPGGNTNCSMNGSECQTLGCKEEGD